MTRSNEASYARLPEEDARRNMEAPKGLSDKQKEVWKTLGGIPNRDVSYTKKKYRRHK